MEFDMGEKSLPLDLVEEFRQPIVDRLTLRLFNKRMINEFDFEAQGENVLLNNEGFQKFCREYEQWMTRKEYCRKETTFRSHIKKQAAELKHAVLKKGPYQPFAWGMNMYVISYDITDNKLRGKIAKKLEGYGRRVQYSVFECEIKKNSFRQLYTELLTLLSGREEEGSIRVYTLCENAAKKQ